MVSYKLRLLGELDFGVNTTKRIKQKIDTIMDIGGQDLSHQKNFQNNWEYQLELLRKIFHHY